MSLIFVRRSFPLQGVTRTITNSAAPYKASANMSLLFETRSENTGGIKKNAIVVVHRAATLRPMSLPAVIWATSARRLASATSVINTNGIPRTRYTTPVIRLASSAAPCPPRDHRKSPWGHARLQFNREDLSQRGRRDSCRSLQLPGSRWRTSFGPESGPIRAERPTSALKYIWPSRTS